MPKLPAPKIEAIQVFQNQVGPVNATIFTPLLTDLFRVSLGASAPSGLGSPGFVVSWVDINGNNSANVFPLAGSGVTETVLLNALANTTIAVSSNFSNTTPYNLYIVVESLQ